MRAAFVTIGQTPRTDLVPEMAAQVGAGITITEFGVLDGASDEEIAGAAPGEEDDRLVTRLRDGSQVVARKDWIHDRLQRSLDRIAQSDFDLVVLLCTGHFPKLQTRGLFLEAQTIVDHAVLTFGSSASTIGVMVPVEEQIQEFHFQPSAGQRLSVSYASPYTGSRFVEAARELADSDLIVMHCIGYTEAMRQEVAAVSTGPVLLARRLVAGAVAQLV
jgi:protein AroM